jgi:hypothetical protein
MTPKISHSERIQNSFQKLAAAAANLNNISDELAGPVEEINSALKKLNIGVTAWTQMEGADDTGLGGSEWWSRDIGYAKIGGKWGTALRTCSGDYSDPDHDNVDSWLFNEAPRWLRVLGIEHLPDLIEKLTAETDSTSKKIRDKIDHAKELALAIREAPSTSTKKK